MISADELQRGQTLTPEQILKQLDAMRTMLLESQGGGHQAYERIRAADPLRRPNAPVQVQPLTVVS
jgi:hypothetical protein